MPGTKSPKNLLLELIGEYYGLKDGELIEKPAELLRVADVKNSKHDKKHPHHEHRVYITRRALKHVVEERRGQLSINHKPADVLQKISFAIEQMPQVIINFDKYEYEPDLEKHFYTKHYPGEPSIRILCEPKVDENKINSLEICSVHFRKQQKDKA